MKANISLYKFYSLIVILRPYRLNNFDLLTQNILDRFIYIILNYCEIGIETYKKQFENTNLYGSKIFLFKITSFGYLLNIIQNNTNYR